LTHRKTDLSTSNFSYQECPALTLSEFDNCPVCGRPCKLEIEDDYREDSPTLDSGLGMEMAYATCKTCKTKWRRKVDRRKPELMVYETWTLRDPKGKLGRWVKIREKKIPVGSV
jgi:hypothetical protein